jgi:hypothetical protein
MSTQHNPYENKHISALGTNRSDSASNHSCEAGLYSIATYGAGVWFKNMWNNNREGLCYFSKKKPGTITLSLDQEPHLHFVFLFLKIPHLHFAFHSQ